LLVNELREDDRVGIVVYSDNTRVVLEPTPAGEKATILAAITTLRSEGSTNMAAGLRLGYQMAEAHRAENEITRVILLSDGIANTGVTDPQGILDFAGQEARKGITLTAWRGVMWM
jgi:Ca-activated chloride channel family protein